MRGAGTRLRTYLSFLGRQMKAVWTRLGQRIRDKLSARGYTCDCCGGEVFEYPVQRLCGDCQSRLYKNDGSICEKCGRKTLAKGICLDCKSELPQFTKGFSPLEYRGETCALINRLKNGDRRLSYFLGAYMADSFLQEYTEKGRFLREGGEEEWLIVYVPATQERVWQRGYNQAEDLAHALANELFNRGYAVAEGEEVLVKTRETVDQKHLGQSERRKNLSGAFHAHKRKICRGKTILLIDDVMTTGATGSECAKVLLGAGAEKVLFLSAASVSERK